ncbi:hypothetical protein LP117_13835 [Moraxella bovis]|uniref:hypothetical protein n=1 Tax=Moraxella bovis TaxID=476 RepID=UPI002225D299|nr:hypothetical protein [Moraxella bovis]UZA24797.1 hypothetical protein LP117_13835 [Moraxella bovis]
MKTLNDMNEYKEDFHYYDIIDGKEVTVNDVHLTACLFFRDGHLQENTRAFKRLYQSVYGTLWRAYHLGV